jgi:hypothetical protein
MKINIFFVFFLTNNLALIFIGGIEAQMGNPMPMPQVYEKSSSLHSLNSHEFSFGFAKNSFTCDLTILAFNRYHKIIFNPLEYAIGEKTFSKEKKKRTLNTSKTISRERNNLKKLLVNINQPCKSNEYPSLDSDESCNFKN